MLFTFNMERMNTLSVSYEAIIHKMFQQLQLAKGSQTNDKNLKQHISHVHMLCELILDEDHTNVTIEHMTENIQSVVKEESIPSAQPDFQEKKLNDDDANGDSIFDF